ncbi:IS701 family transposase [Streptomyces mirabilis]|uniref:IS701 family transposase n=1 Tax=Streptomyces mirabilis TaxID=68239 RepID=UPI0036DE0978
MSVHEAHQRLAPAHAEGVSDFSDDLFAYLPRADQRRWAEAYLRGLLTTSGKKSVRRMAAAISSSPTASHSLQQFLNASPWDWTPARRELTRLAEKQLSVQAWSIGVAVLPKRGEHSVGVHRSFIPSVGRTLNCQQGVGIFLSTDEESVAVDWSLALPGPWTNDPKRRHRARIPDSVRHQSPGADALELVDALASHATHAPAPIVADMSNAPDAATLLRGLSQRGHDFVIAVPENLQVVDEDPSTAPHARHLHPGGHSSINAQQLLRRSSQRKLHAATERKGGRLMRRVRVASTIGRLAGSDHAYDGGEQVLLRLFTECRTAGRARVWATNLVHGRIDDLLGLVRLHGGTANSIGAMRDHYGLLDFEGRSFPGWHHHMTLVSAAHAYQRLAREPNRSCRELVHRRTAA